MIQRIIEYLCPRRQEVNQQEIELLDLKRQIVNGRRTNRYFCLGTKPYFLMARYDYSQQCLAEILDARLQGLSKCLVRDSKLVGELSGLDVRVDPQSLGMLELNDCQAIVFDFRNCQVSGLKDRVKQINAILAVMENIVIICSNHKCLSYLAAVISSKTVASKSAPLTCSVVDCPAGVLLIYGIDNIDNLQQREMQELILRQAGLGLQKNELQQEWALRGGQYFLLKLSQSLGSGQRETQTY